jgi:acyl-CoA synthetase (AMP-forming)/AMP-acid ligase II
MALTQPRLVHHNLGEAIYRGSDIDTPALIYPGSDISGESSKTTWSFRQLDNCTSAVARGLLDAGLQRGDRVAILSANCAEYLAAFFGIMRAGLVAVPVNIKLPPAGVQYIIRDSGARLVLTDTERLDVCPSDIPRILFAENGKNTFAELLSTEQFDAVPPEPRQPAMFLYTSGSTGKPKGVVLSHESHLWVLEKRRRSPLTERQRVLVAAPLYHMNALSTAHAAIAQGDSVVLLSGFIPPNYIGAAARYRCTTLTAVPTMIAMILHHRELLLGTDLSSVRNIRMGSAPVSPGLLDSIREFFPTAQIANVYGTTEAGPIVFAPHPDGIESPQGSPGYPHPDVQLRLYAATEPNPGEGILEIKCPALMNGYHNLPDLTASVLTQDGYYSTGDVFRRDENGFFFFIGRTDDMFVCGGENIYPREVETMLERHPAVEQACVVPIQDELKWQKPVAFVVARPGVEIGENEIRQYTLQEGPAYQHPRCVWFLDQLPLAGTNKVDRNALSRLAMERIASEPNLIFKDGEPH